MIWLTVTECLCYKGPRICSVCRNHYLVLSSFMNYHRVCNKSNTTGATSASRTTYSSGIPESWIPPTFLVRLTLIHATFNNISISVLSLLCIMFCWSLFVLFFATILSVLLLITSLVSSNSILYKGI